MNENIAIRELAPGSFAVFSTDKNEFLKIDGKEITLDKDTPLVLVLPDNHTLKTLDLTLKTADGTPATNDAWIVVENHRKESVEIIGNNIAVMGNATMQVTQYELAGIDTAPFKDKKIDIVENATHNATLNDDSGLHNAPGLVGNVLHYNGKNIAVLEGGFGGRIDLTDKNHPGAPEALLMLNNMDDHGRTRGRIMQMQNNVMKSFADASKIDDPAKRKEAFVELGLNGPEAAGLESGQDQPWKSSPGNPLYPAVPRILKEGEQGLDEDEIMRKKPTPLRKMEERIEQDKEFEKKMKVPDGRVSLAALDTGNPEKTAQTAPTQQAFDEALSRGLDPQVAYAVAKMNANKNLHSDHNSIEAPSVPGAGGARRR